MLLEEMGPIGPLRRKDDSFSYEPIFPFLITLLMGSFLTNVCLVLALYGRFY